MIDGNMKKLTRFEKFLFNRNLLEKFERNLKKNPIHFDNIKELMQQQKMEHYVQRSFSWYYSPEGLVFWATVNAEWVEYLEYNTL